MKMKITILKKSYIYIYDKYGINQIFNLITNIIIINKHIQFII